MRTKILTLATSVAVGFIALIGVQGSAQAYEYHRYHVTRAEHRDHDRDRFQSRFFSHYRHYRDHDRR